MRDVFELDVERRGVEQIEPAAGQHALPGARLLIPRRDSTNGCSTTRHLACRALAERRRRRGAGELCAGGVTVAGHEMVVDHPYCLHEGIHDCRPDKLEAAAGELLRKGER